MAESAPLQDEYQDDVYERHFGQHELMDLPVKSLIMLPQIRGTVNAQLPKLKSSIDQIGLINPPNVARPNRWELLARQAARMALAPGENPQ